MALRVNNVQTAAYPRCMPTVWQWRGRTEADGWRGVWHWFSIRRRKCDIPSLFLLPHSFSPSLSQLLLLHRAALKCFTFMNMWPNLTLRLAGSTCSSPLCTSLSTSATALCRLLGGLGKIQSEQLFDKLQRQRTQRSAAQKSKKSALNFSWIQLRRRLGFSSTLLGLALGLANFALTGIGRDGGSDRVSLWAKLITWSLSSYEVGASLFYVVDIMRLFSLVTLIERVVNTLTWSGRVL